jgi:hypothetical protein
MDIEQMAERLPPNGELPGVALLVARDVIESSVLAGALDAEAASCLRAAGQHLRQADRGCAGLVPYPQLAGQLLEIANAGQLPEAEQLGIVRTALRDLVHAIPAEGSVSPDAEYAGF